MASSKKLNPELNSYKLFYPDVISYMDHKLLEYL